MGGPTCVPCVASCSGVSETWQLSEEGAGCRAHLWRCREQIALESDQFSYSIHIVVGRQKRCAQPQCCSECQGVTSNSRCAHANLAQQPRLGLPQPNEIVAAVLAGAKDEITRA